MADEIVDAWRPATGARLQALAAKSHVMADDALATARRIRQPVRSTSEALEAFDRVTYAKGRAVLAMTEAWLGPDAFRAGLRGYLQRHEWGNATADDLYAALGEASGGRDVGGRDAQLHGSDRRPDRRRDASTARRDRRRPSACASRNTERSIAPRTAPRCGAFRSASSTGRQPAAAARAGSCTVLTEQQTRRWRWTPSAGCPRFVYANAGETGYYRVRDRRRRARGARRGRHPVARARALRRRQQRLGGGARGQLPVVGVSRSAACASRTTRSRLVWTEMLAALCAIDRALMTDADRPAFARFVRALCGPDGAAPRLALRGDAVRRRTLPARGDPGRARRSRRGRRTLAEAGRAARAPGWSAAVGRRARTWRASRCRSPRSTATRRCSIGCWAWSSSRPRPRAACWRSTALGSFDDPGADRTDARRWCSTARSRRRTCVTCSRRSACGRRRATSSTAWIERHFDELARLFPSFIAWAASCAPCPRCATPTACAPPRHSCARAPPSWKGVDKDLRQSVEEGLRCAALADAARADAARWLRRRL